MNFRRLKCLIYKEWLQLMRDKSLLAAAFALPIMLLAVYGFGMRMDVEPVRASLVVVEPDPLNQEIYACLAGSHYFEVEKVGSIAEAQQQLRAHAVDLWLMLTPSGQAGEREIFAAINGTSAQGAQLAAGYVQSALQPLLTAAGGLQVTSRLWFNEKNRSEWYLLPGQIAGIAALVCNVLCSLIISREFNRGTMAALLSTKVTALELIAGKLIPYYLLSLCSAALMLGLSFAVFALPLRGSFAFLTATMALYCLACCLFGLWLSSLVRDQFLAMEYAIILSFLPALLLSGALFDLRAVPEPIALIGYLLHPTYAVQSFRICYLSGGQEDILWRNLGIMGIYCLLFAGLLYRSVRRFKNWEDRP